MKKTTLLWCFLCCFISTALFAQTPAELAEIQAAQAEKQAKINVTKSNDNIGVVNENLDYHIPGNTLKKISDHQNRLADIIPTAGATETFAMTTADTFFDPGGPGGSATDDGAPGNYPNCGCITTTTITGPTEIQFNEFVVNATFDWLVIYDGTDTSGPELYNNNTGGANEGDITLSDMIASNGSANFVGTSGSFTFEFRSSTVVNRLGWEVISIDNGGGGCPIDSDCNLVDATPDDATSPNVWDRPIGAGPTISGLGPVSYDVYGPFTVDTAGDYTFDSTQSGWDGYLHLYEICFDPTDQLTNILAGNDDGPGGVGTSQILDQTLATGVEYYLITSGFEAGEFGDFTNTITGPGTVTCGGGGGGGTMCSEMNPSNGFETFFSSSDVTGTQVLANDITVPDGQDFSVESATVYYLVETGQTITEADLTFFNDAAGIPDASSIVDAQTIVPTSQTIIAQSPTQDVLEVVFDLTPVFLSGAIGSETTYWVSYFATISGGVQGFIEASSASIVGNEAAFSADGGATWGVAAGFELVYDIEGTCSDVITNDDCDDAFAVSCGDVVVGETINDTDSGGNAAPDEFYTYTGSGSPEIVTLSTCNNADFDTLIRVYEDCTLANELFTNDDAAGCTGFTSELNFLSDGTSTYYIMIEGFGSASGNFTLSVDCNPLADNDLCEDAIALACDSVVSGSTNFATLDDGVAPDCANDGSGPDPVEVSAPGVWYTYTETNPGLISDITLSTCDDADFDTRISVYTGDCGTLTCLTASDDDPACSGFTTTVNFQSDGFSTYYILVHGFGSAQGDFNLSIDCTPVPPPNDDIANSIDVDEIGFPYTDPSVNMPGATTEDDTPAGCNNAGVQGVWYHFTPVGDGSATASISNPGGFSSVTFYTAPSESATETDLTLVPSSQNQCVPGTDATIPTTAGQTYYVYVANTGTVTDIVIDGLNLGIGDAVVDGFTYYPNPAEDILNLNAGIKTIDSAVVYNILGQEVVSRTIGANDATLDVSALKVGTYVLKVVVEGEIGIYKIIKQ